jgi:hypothetical protein
MKGTFFTSIENSFMSFIFFTTFMFIFMLSHAEQL